MNLPQTELSLKTKLGLYLALTLTKRKILNFFFQKIKCTTMPVHHVKGQPAASTYVRKKGCLKKDSNRETPCSCSSLPMLELQFYFLYYYFLTLFDV